MGFLSSLLLPFALKIADSFFKKLFITDPQAYAVWTKFMIGAQTKTWISGSTPDEYESAGKIIEPVATTTIGGNK